MTEGCPVAKAHAYGNDFLYVREQDVSGRDFRALAVAVCDRFRGIGADGLVVYRPTPDGTAMRLINSDGSYAEVSGNGVRGLAALLVNRNETVPDAAAPIRIESDGGTKVLTLLERTANCYRFRADMGEPAEIRRVMLEVDGESLSAVTLWMGNPQCVIIGPLPSEDRFRRVGPAIAAHPHFPAGTNVEFAEVVSPDTVRILIWERGAGPTLSSGTGSCASAVAARTFAGTNAEVDVIAPGGSQRVRWESGGVDLDGWAEVVLEGLWLGGP